MQFYSPVQSAVAGGLPPRPRGLPSMEAPWPASIPPALAVSRPSSVHAIPGPPAFSFTASSADCSSLQWNGISTSSPFPRTTESNRAAVPTVHCPFPSASGLSVRALPSTTASPPSSANRTTTAFFPGPLSALLPMPPSVAAALVGLVMKNRAELVVLLKQRGLSTQGSKQDLLQRLLSSPGGMCEPHGHRACSFTSPGSYPAAQGSCERMTPASMVSPPENQQPEPSPSRDQEYGNHSLAHDEAAGGADEKHPITVTHQTHEDQDPKSSRKPKMSFGDMVAYNESQLMAQRNEVEAAPQAFPLATMEDPSSDDMWEEVDEASLLADFRSGSDGCAREVQNRLPSLAAMHYDNSAPPVGSFSVGSQQQQQLEETNANVVSQAPDADGEHTFSLHLNTSDNSAAPVEVPAGTTEPEMSRPKKRRKNRGWARKKGSKRKAEESEAQGKEGWYHCGDDCDSPSSEEGALMVECGICEKWYHATCQGTTAREVDAMPPQKAFSCRKCSRRRKRKTRKR